MRATSSDRTSQRAGLPFRGVAQFAQPAQNLQHLGANQSPRSLFFAYNFSNTGYIGRGPAGGGPVIDPLSDVLTPAPASPGSHFRKASLMATATKKSSAKKAAKKPAKKKAVKKKAKR